MHYDKYKGHQAIQLIRHVSRANQNYTNKNIDPTRTKGNYDALNSSIPTMDRYKQRISEIENMTVTATGKAIRKDAVKLCSWCVTLPKDVNPLDGKRFFQAAADYFSSRYGKENSICAYVHLDETTPHMHFYFIPVQNGQLKAKDLETKQSLRAVHKELEDIERDILGYEPGIINGSTPKKALELEEYKAKKLYEDNIDHINSLREQTRTSIMQSYEQLSKMYSELSSATEQRLMEIIEICKDYDLDNNDR